MEEQWRDLEGFEGYQISSEDNFRFLSPLGYKNIDIKTDSEGKKYVILRSNNKYHKYYIEQ